MLRIAEEFTGSLPLHRTTLLQDHDMVGYLLHYGQVVGDEQEGQPAAGLQFLQEFQQLRLYGYIEGADRFIADEEFGFNCQRPGQQEPLALAAAQLNRVAVDRRKGQVDSLQQIPDAAQEFRVDPEAQRLCSSICACAGSS